MESQIQSDQGISWILQKKHEIVANKKYVWATCLAFCYCDLDLRDKWFTMD